jgi:hypothetical protein
MILQRRGATVVCGFPSVVGWDSIVPSMFHTAAINASPGLIPITISQSMASAWFSGGR